MGRIRAASDEAALREAADLLRAGGLVAFPTETVYGLGANALDPAAVERIFAAKGRPATNPLIVHVADVNAARALAAQWPPIADTLAGRFWPGPLTLVVRKGDAVPFIVTAGGLTVGLRIPAHPAALALLHAAGVPIAAPSANRSEEVSPTTAQHVKDSLGPFVEDLLILDGGPTEVGIESTVLDLTAMAPRILRPGMVTAQMLRDVVGDLDEGPPSGSDRVARSPGLTKRHYAPRASVMIVPSGEVASVLKASGTRSGLIAWQAETAAITSMNKAAFYIVAMPSIPASFGARLYTALRGMDAVGVSRIIVEEPPTGDGWTAIHDRLRRAATAAQNKEA